LSCSLEADDPFDGPCCPYPYRRKPPADVLDKNADGGDVPLSIENREAGVDG